MAEPDIRLLVGVAEGGADGDSKALIEQQLSDIMKNIHVDASKFQEQIGKAFEAINKDGKFAIQVSKLSLGDGAVNDFKRQVQSIVNTLRVDKGTTVTVGAETLGEVKKTAGRGEQTQVILRESAALREKSAAAKDAAAATENETQKELRANAAKKNGIDLLARMQKALRDWTVAKTGRSSASYSLIEEDARALSGYISQLESGEMEAETFQQKLKGFSASFADNSKNIKEAGENTRTWLERMGGLGKKFGEWLSVSRIVMSVWRAVKQMISATIELDGALTQLKIVTGATDAEMSRFLTHATSLSKGLGKSISEMVSSIEVFSRLGYGLSDSSTLAKYAAILSNVAAVGQDEATTGITSIIKGYNMDVKNTEHVADVLVEVGQKYAVSAAEMMEAYEKSGAALNATNTSFEKSAGLIAAANASVQNASTVGTALKTISARIRGSKSELAELGEDPEELADGFSKYAEEIRALTGFNIMQPGTTNQFKDIYDILGGIAQVWGKLSDTQQARVAEILGGTRQLQVISSIIGNWKDAANAYADAMDAAGVATKANDTYLESVNGHIAQFKATFQEVIHNLMDTGVVSGVVDLGTGLLGILNTITDIINAVGGLNTVLAVTVGLFAIKNAGKITDLMLAAKNSLPFITMFGEEFLRLKSTGVGSLSAIAKAFSGVSAAAGTASVATGVFVAAIVAIVGIAALYNQLHKSTEELREEYDELRGKLDAVNEEFKTTGERILELQKLSNRGTITLVEQEELDKLKAANIELLEEKRLLEENMLLKGKEVNDALAKDFQKRTKLSIEADSKMVDSDAYYAANKDAIDLATEAWGELQSPEALSKIKEMTDAEADSLREIYSTWTQLEFDAVNSPREWVNIGDYISQLIERYKYLESLGEKASDGQRAQLKELRAELVNASTELNESYIRPYNGKDETVGAWKDQFSLVDATINPAEHYTDLLETLPQKLKSILNAEGKKGNLTADRINELSGSYKELDDWMKESGKTAEDLAKHYNTLSSSVEDKTEEVGGLTDSGITDKLNAIKDSYASLSTVMKDLSENGRITYTTLSAIKEKFAQTEGIDEFISKLSAMRKDSKDVNKTLSELMQAYIDTGDNAETLASTDENLIAAMLKEIGVTNASTTAARMLAYAKKVATAHAVALAVETATTKEETDGLSVSLAEEAAACGMAENAMAHLTASIILADGTKLSFKEQIEQLKKLYTAAGLTRSEMNMLASGYNLEISQMKRNGATQEEIAAVEEQARQALRKQLEDQLGASFQANFEESGGKKSGSGSSVKEYLADIEKYRHELEALDEAGRRRNDTELRLDKAKSLDEEIALREELIGVYREEQEAFHALAQARRRDMEQGAAELRGMGFDVQQDSESNKFFVTNMERVNTLEAADKGTYDSRQEATNELRRHAEALIKELESASDDNAENSLQWLENHYAIIEKTAEQYEALTNALERRRDMEEKWLDNAISEQDTQGTLENAEKIVRSYKAMQENIHAQAEYYRSEGYAEDSEQVNGLSQLWWEYEESIREVKGRVIDYLGGIVDASHSAVDQIQSVYSTLQTAAEEYASNGGFISIDTFQDVLKLGPEYMQMLQDENGQLTINRKKIDEVTAAKTRQVAVDTAMTYVERLKLALEDDAVEELNELLYATEKTTGATWGLVYANLALLKNQLGDKGYEAALHNVRAMESLAAGAIGSIGKGTEEFGTLLDYVMDMLKQRVEDHIDDLEEMKKSYAELINLRKEALDKAKEEADYEDEVAEKVKAIAKLQSSINRLSLDDSREAAAKRAKLEEEMAQLQKELGDAQRDHAIENQKESLDKMQEAYEEEKDAEIEAARDSISSYQKLYDLAMDYVTHKWNTDWKSLYNELIDWNHQYGSDLNEKITEAWNAARLTAQEYFRYVDDMSRGFGGWVSTDGEGNENNPIILGSQGGANGSGGGSNTVADSRYSGVYAKVRQKLIDMEQNSADWLETENPKAREWLQNENERLSREVEELLGVKLHRGEDGVWYLPDGRKLYDVYGGKFHTGGIVGGGDELRGNEVLARLEKGESVLTEGQKDGLLRLVDFTSLLTKQLGSLAANGDGARLFGGGAGLNEAQRQTLESAWGKQETSISFGNTYIYGCNEETVEQLQEVNREMVNQVLETLNIE